MEISMASTDSVKVLVVGDSGNCLITSTINVNVMKCSQTWLTWSLNEGKKIKLSKLKKNLRHQRFRINWIQLYLVLINLLKYNFQFKLSEVSISQNFKLVKCTVINWYNDIYILKSNIINLNKIFLSLLIFKMYWLTLFRCW